MTAQPALLLSLVSAVILAPLSAQDAPRLLRDRDRGPGVPSSMFATYLARGQLLVFPFVAYTRDHNMEYEPALLGYGGVPGNFRGRFESFETQLFLGYGVTDWLALEFEASHMQAALDKDAADSSTMPSRLRARGLGDFEGQVRMRVLHEQDRRPELFAYFEVTAPSHQAQPLIADGQWDFRPGLGIVRGFAWGTMTTRVNLEYNHDDKLWDLGEYSIEYLRQVSPALHLNLAIEGGETGAPDEWNLIAGLHWQIGDRLSLRIDNGLGLSPKAPDWVPQIGVMLALPN